MKHLLTLSFILFSICLFAQIQYTQIEGNLRVDGRLSFSGNSSSVYIGFLAGLRTPSSSGGNTFVGSFAGERAEGINNTFFGFLAGQGDGLQGNLNSGSNNSYFGYNVNPNLSTYSYNSFFGANSGATIFADSCVIIGSSAGPKTNPRRSQSQRLYIDVVQSNDPLLYGEFDNNLVRVNGGFQVNNSSDQSPILIVDDITRDLTIWSGKLGIGIVPTADHKLNVNGSAAKSTTGGWIFNSDARLKKDITHLNSSDVLQKVLAMQGVYYKWNDPRKDIVRYKGTEIGFLAQDLQKIWPEKVTADAQGYLQTSYGDFDPMFVEAIKAQQDMITSLQDKKEKADEIIQALVDKNQQLEKRLSDFETRFLELESLINPSKE